MASLSPSFIMNDLTKNKNNKNESALHLSLSSVIAGSIHPLLMLDTEEAQNKPVVFDEAANS